MTELEDKEKEITEPVVREVGERVDFQLSVDTSTVKDLGDGVFEAIVTTPDIDRMGESIDYAGITTTAYMKNPVVLYGHDYQGLPIGKTLKLTKSNVNKNWTARFQLAVDILPFAATVAAMIKGGYLNAVSIGGIVKQWSPDYTKIEQMEMVEFSVVPVPANPSALITGRSFEELTGKTVEKVAQEYHEFVQMTVADKLKGIDKDELSGHIQSLESLVAILKDTASAKETGDDLDEVTTIRLRKAAGKVSQTGQDIIKLVRAPKG